jgi:hypothetical protein
LRGHRLSRFREGFSAHCVNQCHIPLEDLFFQDRLDLSGKNHRQHNRKAVQQQRETPGGKKKSVLTYGRHTDTTRKGALYPTLQIGAHRDRNA